MSEKLLPRLSSRDFMASGLTYRSLIHLEFIFVYNVRKWSSFILLHVAVQFFQHHLSKTLSFPCCIFLPPLLKINWPYNGGFIPGISILLHWSVYFCASTILFWLLQLCDITWSLELWCLQLCFSFSGLLWLFGIFCGSTQTLGLFILVLWKMLLVFW